MVSVSNSVQMAFTETVVGVSDAREDVWAVTAKVARNVKVNTSSIRDSVWWHVLPSSTKLRMDVKHVTLYASSVWIKMSVFDVNNSTCWATWDVWRHVLRKLSTSNRSVFNVRSIVWSVHRWVTANSVSLDLHWEMDNANTMSPSTSS